MTAPPTPGDAFPGGPAPESPAPESSAPESPAPAGDVPDRLYVHAVEKAFRVLEAFAAASGPMSLSQLAAAAGLDKSGAQRMGHTLTRLGYLEQTPAGLRPGHRVLERSFDFLRTDPLVRRAYPMVAELRGETGERVDLSRFTDLHIMFLVRMPSRRQAFYAYLNGRRLPSFCTAGGRAALSRLPEPAVHDILRRSDLSPLTPRTLTAPDAILAAVAQARADGFALVIEEVQPGEITVAAPVLDEAGRPAGAIHLAASLADWTPDAFRRRFAPLVVSAAHAASFT